MLQSLEYLLLLILLDNRNWNWRLPGAVPTVCPSGASNRRRIAPHRLRPIDGRRDPPSVVGREPEHAWLFSESERLHREPFTSVRSNPLSADMRNEHHRKCLICHAHRHRSVTNPDGTSTPRTGGIVL